MAITPLVFTGISQFSADFQTILNRTVAIAALPVNALQNEQVDLLQKKQLTATLSGAVADLSESVKALGALGTNRALSATSSNTSKVTVTNTAATAAANYTISNITSVAKAASESSVQGYAAGDTTAVSVTGSVRLVVGTTEYNFTLTPAKNNLAGLRDAINGLGAGVTANILTTGTGATPNYLSVSANTTGAKVLKVIDDPAGAATNLLTAQNQGADATFDLNGVRVSKSSNLINDVVPGITFTVMGVTGVGETVTLSLVSDRSRLESALRDLATKYNAVAGLANAQIGPDAGLLAGDPLVREVQSSLRKLTMHHQSGTVRNVAALGIELSKTGEMSFKQATFDKLSSAQVSDAFAFLGSERTGFGALSAAFTQISDPITGMVKIQQGQYDAADRRITDHIAKLTARIQAMQAGLSAKLQAADALLAHLDSQQLVLNSSLESLNAVAFGKRPD
jgi:flagellar hook-associated protein 2